MERMGNELRQRYWRFLEGFRRFQREQLAPWPRMLRACLPRGARVHCGQPRREFLFLSWNFPPLINGGVYRPTAICQGAVRAGWRVSVIAGVMPDVVTAAGEYLLKRVPNSVKVIRTVPHDLKARPLFLSQVDGGVLNALETFELARKAFRDEPPPIVVASGPPFQSFVAGRWLADYFGSRLVLDYRDEWTECPFDFVNSGPSDRRWEERCIRRADRVIFATRAFQQHAQEIFADLPATKCRVVPNGWDPKDLSRQLDVRPRDPRGDKIVLGFFGALADHTLPGEFFESLAAVLATRPSLADRLRLRFVGQRSPTAERQLQQFPYQNVLDVHEQVAKPAAIAMMQTCDALLLLNPEAFSRYIPGKLYDYISSATPVLVYGSGGEAARIVQELRAGLVVPNNSAALADAIDRLAIGLTIDQARVAEWLAAHTREKTSDEFVSILEEILLSTSNR